MAFVTTLFAALFAASMQAVAGHDEVLPPTQPRMIVPRIEKPDTRSCTVTLFDNEHGGSGNGAKVS